MSQPQTSNRNICRSIAMPEKIFAIVMILSTLSYQAANANTIRPATYRVSVAGDKFSDTWQSAATFHLRAPRRIRAKRLELAVGTVSASNETRPFVSFGPVWKIPTTDRRLFLELGSSPTLFAGSTFNNRDLGGNLRFTSSVTIGTTFGARDASSISLRIQHTSNGGLNNANPGMDMIGINFAFNFEQ